MYMCMAFVNVLKNVCVHGFWQYWREDFMNHNGNLFFWSSV